MTLPRLETASAELEAALGVSLGNPDFPFVKNREVNWEDAAEIEQAADWLVAETRRYEASAAAYLKLKEENQ